MAPAEPGSHLKGPAPATAPRRGRRTHEQSSPTSGRAGAARRAPEAPKSAAESLPFRPPLSARARVRPATPEDASQAILASCSQPFFTCGLCHQTKIAGRRTYVNKNERSVYTRALLCDNPGTRGQAKAPAAGVPSLDRQG